MLPILEGLASFLDMRRQAFPDVMYTIEDVLAEGDKVFGRLTMHGTHTGAFLGSPDMVSLLRQIGAIKERGSAGWQRVMSRLCRARRPGRG